MSCLQVMQTAADKSDWWLGNLPELVSVQTYIEVVLPMFMTEVFQQKRPDKSRRRMGRWTGLLLPS